MATGGFELANVANQALGSIGWPERIADLEDGSQAAGVINDYYWNCRQLLLRACHWDSARFQAPLTLLADASGATPDVGTLVQFNYQYEYAYPTDCMKMRFIPWNYANNATVIPADNTQIPTTPLVGGEGAVLPPGTRLIPAKFVLSTDSNYPPPAGSDVTGVQGVSPQGRTVILTNVRYAQAIYTRDMLYPENWDPLFRSALVAYVAAEIAVPIWAKKDPSQKVGIASRDRMLPIVRDKLTQARATNGNEGAASADISVDWMRTRRVGGYGNAGWGNGNWSFGGGDGIGQVAGWDSLILAGGASF